MEAVIQGGSPARVQVANGFVGVRDWVRELPANHFQPCYCCLCRPQGGERPALQVQGIVRRDGTAYVQVPELGEIRSDEVERVDAPPPVPRSAFGRSDASLRTYLQRVLQQSS